MDSIPGIPRQRTQCDDPRYGQLEDMENPWPDSIAGTPDDGLRVKDLIIKYARDADKATIFNFASMAYNNHFMFSTLVRHPLSPLPFFPKSSANLG